MKKYLILLMMSVLFACNSQAGYVLKGVFKGAGDGSAILRMHSKGKLVICDTVKMKRLLWGYPPGSLLLCLIRL